MSLAKASKACSSNMVLVVRRQRTPIPISAFIYATVLSGAIRSQVNDGPATVYRAGESFSEIPGDHHAVSENASKTEPAKLLAVFVVDSDEKNLTTNDAK
jgi:quercetin dioxygenase-like cupin family protein